MAGPALLPSHLPWHSHRRDPPLSFVAQLRRRHPRMDQDFPRIAQNPCGRVQDRAKRRRKALPRRRIAIGLGSTRAGYFPDAAVRRIMMECMLLIYSKAVIIKCCETSTSLSHAVPSPSTIRHSPITTPSSTPSRLRNSPPFATQQYSPPRSPGRSARDSSST
jgi:hypothetical protein